MTSRILDLNRLVDDALKMNLQEFVKLTQNAVELLSNENGPVGHFKIEGRLIEASPQGNASIVGDLHGDLDSLVQILKKTSFLEKAAQNERSLLIFLGDYGDRGMYSPEVYYIVLKLKLTLPKSVILMRGNHEGPDELLPSPHDLPAQLRNRFGEDWSAAYLKLRALFGQLYNAVIVRNRFVLLHGGVPSRARSLDDLAYAHLKYPRESHLEEILWSDPEEDIKGTLPSPRGAGRLFGPDVTIRFLEMLKVNALVRGHEPCDQGYKVNHEGRLMTLFSRKGEPYFNNHGAFLSLDLADDVKDATQLRSHVTHF